MSFTATTATKRVMSMTKRIRAVQGGTSASKTISILLCLINIAQTEKNNLISIVSESYPHLRRGAIKDFLNIMKTQGYYKDQDWNKTESTYTFETGSQIEFFSTDNGDKLRGARRDWLFMNEANNIHFDAFEQLEVRTKKATYMDWNPSNSFWFYDDVLAKRNDVEHIILTYLDNESLDKSIVDSIEMRRNRAGWWQVYGLGQLGEVEGKIYKDWAIIDKIPHEARLERRGLDFGYSNDPTVIVDIYRYNGGFIVNELISKKGMSNREIADLLLEQEQQVLLIADSAEPKSIDEIKARGVMIVGAMKGPGSVNTGIAYVQDQRISVTQSSVNVIKSYRNYLWDTDKNGKILNVPNHDFSDEMDACLIANTLVLTNEGNKTIDNIVSGDMVMTRNGYQKVLSSGITGKDRKIYRLTDSEGNILKGTSNHPIFTDKGWINLCDIRYGDRIVVWKQVENITEKDITSIQKQNSLTEGNIFTMAKSLFIDKYIKTKLVRFQKGCTSITKIVIRLITALKTSSYSAIPSMANFIGLKKTLLSVNASNVKKILPTIIEENQTNSAQINAKADLEENQVSTTSASHAYYAEKRFLATNMQTPCIALANVVEIIELNDTSDVYNLEVENDHEYFANNILVHNCRYALSSFSKPTPGKPLVSKPKYVYNPRM